MKILEIIHLRTAGRSLDSLIAQIRGSIGPDVDDGGVVTVYRRSGLDTDVAIHVNREGRAGPHGPSALGLRLASALSTFGLVEHTVWEERT